MAQRFVFILDNSDSLLVDCFSVDQVPTHSEPRAAMRDMTVFVVDLLGELTRAAMARGAGQPAPLEIGIYAMHPYQSRRELVAVQDILEFEPGWDEPLAAQLDFHHVDKFGWDMDWLDDKDALIRILAPGPDVENRVILMTDGYTGEPPTPQAPANPTADVVAERSNFIRDIEQLTQPTPESVEDAVVSFHVVRFSCPNLATNHTFAGDKEYLWQGLIDDNRIQLHDLVLPRSVSESDYDRAGAWQSFEHVVQELLKEFEGTVLWPPQMATYDGVNRLVGFGWLPAVSSGLAGASSEARLLPTEDSPALLPGNTASFALRLVTASPGQAGYSVVFKRDDRTFRYPLNYVNSGHVYAIDPADHALRDVLSVESDRCAPIVWWLEGPDAPAFGWWSTEPARYTIDAELMSAAAVVNNAPIGVTFRVDEILAEPGHADCYEVRVRLGITERAGELLHTRPLRQLYPGLRGSYVFDYYPFIPRDHEGLVVNVDLVESLDREAGDLSHPGDPAQRVVMDAADQISVENVYEPRFSGQTSSDGDDDCKQEEEGCTFTVTFEFANSAYFPGNSQVPEQQVFALNISTGEQLEEGGDFKNDKTCDKFLPNEDKPETLEGGRERVAAEEAFQSGLPLYETGGKFAYEDSDSPRREFSLKLFTEEQVSNLSSTLDQSCWQEGQGRIA